MRITLTDVSKQPALGVVSLTYGTGEAVLARAETEQRPTVLGLLASGRMKPGTGTITIDGDSDVTAVRRQIALIDAPEVSDPAPNVTVAGVTAEELMFAGLPSGPLAVARKLDELGLRGHARDSIGQVAPRVRIRLLVELALLRDGVKGIVLTSPDRHGGDPNMWWHIALEVASRGYAVLVIAGDASAAAIAASSLVARLETPWAADPEPDDDPGRDDSDAPVAGQDAFTGLPDTITRPVPIVAPDPSDSASASGGGEPSSPRERGESKDSASASERDENRHDESSDE